MAKKRSRTRTILMAVGGLVVVCILCWVVFTLLPSSDEEGAPVSQATTQPENTQPPPPTDAPPTSTPRPTQPPAPTATLEPLAQLENDVFWALNAPDPYEFSYDESSGVIKIRFMLGPRSGPVYNQVMDVLRIVGPSGFDYTKIELVELADLKDSFGNIETTEVFWADFPAETLNQVQWENFETWETLPLIDWATRLESHPDHP